MAPLFRDRTKSGKYAKATKGVILVGTFYPLVFDVLSGYKLSVGGPYFNGTFVPLMVPLILLMAAGPLISWKRADLTAVLRGLVAAACLSVIAAITVLGAH